MIHITMENHHFQCKIPLFLWPFSIAMVVITRQYSRGYETWLQDPLPNLTTVGYLKNQAAYPRLQVVHIVNLMGKIDDLLDDNYPLSLALFSSMDSCF